MNEINATHLELPASVPGTAELKTLATAINSMLDRINEAYFTPRCASCPTRPMSCTPHRRASSGVRQYATPNWPKLETLVTRQEAIDAITAEAASMKELVEQLLFLARRSNFGVHALWSLRTWTSPPGCRGPVETEMIDQTHQFSAQWGGPCNDPRRYGLLVGHCRILVDNSISTRLPENIRLAVSSEAATPAHRPGRGPGHDALESPYIFDRFTAPTSPCARPAAPDWGWHCAKWIVDRTTGWFEVTSREGIGTP